MLILLSFILCLVSVYFIWRRKGVSINEPPLLPGALPIIGHAHLAYGDTTHLLDFIKRITKESVNVGGVVKVLLGPLTLYVLTDPVDSLSAMNACLEKSEVYKLSKRFVGDGLITADDQTSKMHRKLLNPMFKQQALNRFLKEINVQAQQLVDNLKNKLGKGPFEYEHYILVWTLKSFCKTIMGVDIGDETKESNDFVNALNGVAKIYTQRVYKVWTLYEHLYNWSGLRKEEDKLIGILKKRTGQVLSKRKAILKDLAAYDAVTSDDFVPFIDHILMLSTEKGALTDEEIMDEVNTLIIAAYDSTGHTLSFVFMMLGAHRDVQERLYEELVNIFGNSDRDIGKYDLPKMVYTEAVIKETLRLFPTVPLYAKRSTTDIKLSKYTLRAGAQVVVSALGSSCDPMWGPDVDQFRPERWLDTASVPDNQNAFSVFGMGKRSCIGRAYALMFMKAAVANIVRRYKITSHNNNPKCKMEIVMRAATPLLMSLEKRE